MPPDQAILLSIKPGYAVHILNGSKTVELRRTRPRVDHGAIALIYATSPVCALVGCARVVGITQAPPAELWARVEGAAGLDRFAYDTYFAGASNGVAIFVADATSFPAPIPLDELREEIPGFTPPQSYRYMDIRDCGRWLSVPAGG